MNTYNAEKFIKESIQSVIDQTYTNWELIVFDNCSNDNTKNIVNLFKDKRIKYIYSNEHTHLGIARYKAQDYLDGEFLGILDSDDIWHKDKLTKQIENFNDKIAIVYSNTIFFNKFFEKKLYSTKQPSGYLFYKLLFKYNISLESILIDRSKISNLDYFFDRDYELISDFDLILRLSSKYKIFYLNEVLSKWRMHNNNSSKGKLIEFINEKLFWIKKNSNLMNKKIRLKLIKSYNIDKALLLICDNDMKKAKEIFLKNYFLNFKSIFIFYIFNIKLFNSIFIKIYKKRIGYNELV